MKISETILEQNLPQQIKFGYQSGMGYNEVEMVFEEIDANSVKQTSNSYFEMRGVMKVLGFWWRACLKTIDEVHGCF